MSDVLAANSPPKLGGVPFARFLANGGVVPQENHPVCAFLRRLRDIFINGAATPPNLGGEFSTETLCRRTTPRGFATRSTYDGSFPVLRFFC